MVYVGGQLKRSTMERVTENVYAETRVRGCNPSYVVTPDGVVVIDTPQLPTHAVRMRKEAEARGPIRYLINTEHHVDHIFGNYYFKGAGIVVSHAETARNFMTVTPEINPYKYAHEAIPSDDPEGEKIWPEEETYFNDPNRPAIVFEGDLTIHLGGHTFELIHTPGHTPGQLAVHIPEERLAVVGDTIFNGVQTWLYASDVDRWIESLDRLKKLEVDRIIPGHGPVCTRHELDVQKAFLLEWIAAVQSAIARGLSREQCVTHIRESEFARRFAVDIGQEYMLDHVIEHNASALYDTLRAK
jgi:cyclase